MAIDPDGFVKCRKPDCFRKVPPSSAYCCPPCANGDEQGAEVEPYSPDVHPFLCHSAACEDRARERGQYGVHEADLYEQRG